MNQLFTLGFLMLAITSVPAQEIEYRAYLTSSLDLWERVVAKKEADFERNADPSTRFELAKSLYGLLNATMKDKDEAIFDQYVVDAEQHLKALIKEGSYRPESKALLSAVIGLQIGYSPWKGMFLGSKAARLAAEALEEAPDSPIALRMYGNNRFFTPAMWGGDNKVAIESFERAIQQFESQGRSHLNWLYLDTFAWLGQAYEKQGDLDSAKKAYERALKIEQGFDWIKLALLPSLVQK